MKLNIDGCVTKDQNEIAEALGNYFANIAEGIGEGEYAGKVEELEFMDHPSVSSIGNNADKNFKFDFQALHTSEVKKSLSDLNPSKATGWDWIPPKVLKLGAEQLSIPLTTLYNNCITQGKWPSKWKWGEWVPVFKKDDCLERENYRPETVKVTVNKVFEQLLAKQVTSRFDDHLSEFLTAYRKRHSCETALTMLIENWRAAVDKGKLVGLLSTDMSKAFDSMHHQLMLAKLKAYGTCDHSIDLIRSYFSDRLSRVRLGNMSSTWKHVNRGCPKNSAFGPLCCHTSLFNLFSDKDCHRTMRDSNTVCFVSFTATF